MLKELLKEKMEKVKPHKMDEPSEIKKEYFPTLHLNSKDLAEIKDWEVGKDYYVAMKITQTSSDMQSDEKGERWSASFDIKEIGVLDKSNAT